MSPDALTIEALCRDSDAPEDVRHFAHIATEVVFAAGSLEQVGTKAAALGGRRVLLVTDPGILAVGHAGRAQASLEAAGLSVTLFSDVHENPTTLDVDRCLSVAREAAVDLIVGLGGGSSMDTAKGCNFLLTNGGEMRDYWGVGKATLPMIPLIAIPTTSGTGSECQSFALIADAETHIKMACGDKKAAAKVALLDPELTVTLPPRVTAATGIDAVAHALETAVCNKRSESSLAYSRLAWQLLNRGLDSVFENPADITARARVHLGAAYAGTAIETSMLGAAHSCANPLTARFQIIHGIAVGIMLSHVVTLNEAGSSAAAAVYATLGDEPLVWRLGHLLGKAGVPTRLRDHGVPIEALPELAVEAAKQWTAQFNPVEVGEPEMLALYRAAW